MDKGIARCESIDCFGEQVRPHDGDYNDDDDDDVDDHMTDQEGHTAVVDGERHRGA